MVYLILMNKLLQIAKEIRTYAREKGNTPVASQSNSSGLNENYKKLNKYLNPDSPNEFTLFLKDDIQLLIGLYVFIDPIKLHRSKTSNQMPFYLWGEEFFKDKEIKPSFELPTFVNVPDERGEKAGLTKPDDCFKEFIQTINEHYRQTQIFDNQDFVVLFRDGHLSGKRNDIEKKLDILYVPSGEIDHCIQQLLILYFISSLPSNNKLSLDSEVGIDLCQLTRGNKLMEYWANIKPGRLKDKLDKIFINESEENTKSIKLRADNYNNTKKIRDWYKDWGYLNEDDIPTEKMKACLEYFYFLLSRNSAATYYDLRNYLDLFDSSKILPPRYFEKLSSNAAAFNELYSEILNPESKNKPNWDKVIKLYFAVLSEWNEKENGKDFAEKRLKWFTRGRVRTFIHFLNRSFHGYFSESRIERSCRGVIFFPILDMPYKFREEEVAGKEIKYAGFFMCNIKDSDKDGNNFFNWYRSASGEENPEIGEFYNTIIPKLQMVANLLGKIEIDEIFFNGIVAQSIKEQYQQAMRAAVSQVMSRNLSHNIGSHVLARLSSLQELKRIIGKSRNDRYDKNAVEDFAGKVANLNSYLRTRMDFLADIATNVPVVTAPKKLFRDICIYLKPDSSNQKLPWQEMLLNYISGTNIREDQIFINVRFNGKQVNSNTANEDPLIAMPNDLLGIHAFYAILENIIRNCAKHSRIAADGTDYRTAKLKLTIFVESHNEKYWKVRIVDNLEQCRHDAKLLTRLNNSINQKMLDPDGTLRKSAWGILEMKTAATYLRKIEPALIDDFHATVTNDISEPPNILVADSDENGNLVYEFFLLKHKQALVVCFNQSLLRKDLEPAQAKLKNDGVDFLFCASVNDFKEKFADELDNSATHDFLILLDPTQAEYDFFKSYKKMLPSRVFLYSEKPVSDSCEDWSQRLEKNALLEKLKDADGDAVNLYLWKALVSGENDENDFSVINYKSENEEPVRLLNAAGKESAKIVFDCHGAAYKCGKFSLEDVFYYEPYGSVSPTGLLIGNRENIVELPYEIVEAAQLSVVIIDERVQFEAEKTIQDANVDGFINQFEAKFGHSPRYRHLLELMKIYIPDSQKIINLNNQHFAPADEARLLNDFLGREISRKEILVVHLGIIEKLLKVFGHDSKERIKNWITERESEFKSVIVISGRGKPPNLPEDTKFLHYSLITRYIFEERSKLHLCKVLKSARRFQ